MINSTISGNGADAGASAGGVSVVYEARAKIDSTTIVGNGTKSGGGEVYADPDGSIVQSSILLHNSIIAGGACGKDTGLTSRGGNVVEDPSGCSGLQDSDVVADPRLGRFAKHGGRTPSHSLRPGSPAIGNATKPFRKADQRGVRRDGDPDSGSFER